MRKAGILLAVSSLPSDYGVGDFGENAYRFIDYLAEMQIRVWQILPLNPLGYGNSPYQPFSSSAGDELYISLKILQEEKLITSDLEDFNKMSTSVLYDKVRNFKNHYLREAYHNFVPTPEYEAFVKENKWLQNYALFKTFHQKNNYQEWTLWPADEKNLTEKKRQEVTGHNEFKYQLFLQYIFYSQWMDLKAYANNKEIEIMGDLPIYVGLDSQEVWENKKYFLLNDDGEPTYVAGVPPDYFSPTGQRWGNPIYDWKELAKDDFAFWHQRIGYNQKLFNIVRIDHFRAFDTYWKIPVACPTAIEGEWIVAPGYQLFESLFKENPNLHIVVEDLGDLRPEVHELRDHFHLTGMKIEQFALNIHEKNNDFPDRENLIIYTGTHDNQTLKGWLQQMTFKEKFGLFKYFKSFKIQEKIIEKVMKSEAKMAIVPVQDILNLDDKARMNTPGTVGSPNWEWKMSDFEEFEKQIAVIRDLITQTNRNN